MEPYNYHYYFSFELLYRVDICCTLGALFVWTHSFPVPNLYNLYNKVLYNLILLNNHYDSFLLYIFFILPKQVFKCKYLSSFITDVHISLNNFSSTLSELLFNFFKTSLSPVAFRRFSLPQCSVIDYTNLFQYHSPVDRGC